MTDGENEISCQSQPSNYVPELPGEMDFEASNYIKKTFKCLIFIYRFGSYICKISSSIDATCVYYQFWGVTIAGFVNFITQIHLNRESDDFQADSIDRPHIV